MKTCPSPTDSLNRRIPLRVLFIENQPADVELCLAEMKRAGYDVVWDRVADAGALNKALASATYDVVVADYNMPGWTGLDALKLFRERNADTPFILVTGSLGDEGAVEAVKAGIDDYVLKERIVRLPFAVQRALEEKALRRESEGAKEQLHLQAAALQAAANGILITDHKGTILWANQAMTALTGYTPEELIGQKTSTLKSGQHPASFYEKLWTTIQAGQVWKGEIVNRRKDGSPYTEEMTITPVWNDRGEISHFIAIKQDVTERQKTQDALRQSEKRAQEQFAELAHIYRTAPVGLALFDRDLRFLRINEHLATMNGRSVEEHLGRALREVTPEVADEVEPLLLKIIATGEPVIGIEVTTTDPKTRQPRVALVSYYPLKEEDGTVRAINIVVLDVSERQTMQRQIATLQKFEAIGQLAGGIAHDFNNVIGAMQGWAGLGAEEAPPGSRLRSFFEKIEEQSHRAAGLTRQLLAFARRQRLEPRNLSLNQSVADVTSLLSKVIGAQIELKEVLAPNLMVVRADPTQVEQVLMNLCLNARDAMPSGGRLVIETKNVQLDEEYCRLHTYARAGHFVLLTVSDTGTGMDAATLERIFEPFFTTKQVGQGTGLGLATVYGIVKQHEGFINVYSEPGHGTTFRVYLPASPDAVVEKRKAQPQVVQSGTETILLAEDHDGGREMACEILRRLGYSVLAAPDGAAAVALLKEHRDKIAAAILDVVMPRLNGPDAYIQMTAIRPNLPVIFVTGYTAEMDILNEVAGEGAYILQKPYDPKALARKLREVLDRPNPAA